MSRHRLISVEELTDLLYRCHSENLLSGRKKILIPEFGEYVRAHGYPQIQDNRIRRYPEIREEIEKLNKGSEEAAISPGAVYQTLDPDSFFQKNNTPEKLKKAILQRDQYYEEVSIMAGKVLDQSREMDTENQKLKDQLQKAKAECRTNETARKEAEYSEREQKKKSDQILKRTRKLLNEYLYPGIAAAILAREGISAGDHADVDQESLEKKLLTPESPIRTSAIRSLYDEVSDDEEEMQ